MPGTRCAVAVCRNSFEKSKKNDLNISFHTFPKDEKRRNIWIKACHRKDAWSYKNSTICSLHFTKENFEVDLRSELMNLKIKRKLKPFAIPTLNLKEVEKDESGDVDTQRNVCAEKSMNKEVVEDILDAGPSVSISPLPRVKSLQEKYDELLKENEELRKKITGLKELTRKQKYIIEKDQVDAAKSSKQIEQANIRVQKIEDILKKVFSKTQIELLTERKKKLTWSSDDIAKAFTLRCLGRRAYIFTREKLKYPLPHISTLEKWASNLKYRRPKGVIKMINIVSRATEPLKSEVKTECMEI